MLLSVSAPAIKKNCWRRTASGTYRALCEAAEETFRKGLPVRADAVQPERLQASKRLGVKPRSGRVEVADSP